MKSINRFLAVLYSRNSFDRRFVAASTTRGLCVTRLDEIKLIVTKSAAKRIHDLRKSSGNADLKLRIMVEGGGCSGFQYKFSMDDTMLQDGDIIVEKEGAHVVVDASSFDLVKGSTIDFKQELIRSAFAVVANPQSESACGCGSSFAVKNFSSNPAFD